jgi:hypothetical protein
LLSDVGQLRDIPDDALHLAQRDYAMALGIRGSNDRSMAIQATAGARVLVCDNLAFSGDSGTIVLRKKHTPRLDRRRWCRRPSTHTSSGRANS